MATKKITFDPDAGVPVASNLTIYGGANFKANFNVFDTSNAAFNFVIYFLLAFACFSTELFSDSG